MTSQYATSRKWVLHVNGFPARTYVWHFTGKKSLKFYAIKQTLFLANSVALAMELSDQGLHCLQYCLHHFEALLDSQATFTEF